MRFTSLWDDNESVAVSSDDARSPNDTFNIKMLVPVE